VTVEEKTRSAEEIFKEFKEHSITEFFRKNSQMLGYAGKVRSLTTIVHEYVTNSVTYDTPTVVKIDGRIAVIEIGRLIDDLMNMRREKTVAEGQVESLRGLDNLMALCFDKNSLKLEFKRIKSVHRHRLGADEKIFTIKTIEGSVVEATKHHSLFTLEGGSIVPIKAEALSAGSYIAVPSKGWAPDLNAVSEINLIEEFLKLPPETTEKIGVYGVRSLLYANRTLKNRVKSVLSARDRHYTFYAHYMSCDRLPINLLRHLDPNERIEFYRCKVGFKKGTRTVPNIIKVDEKLARFLGLFTAEGSLRSDLRGIALSFNSDETELIKLAASLVEDIFGIAPQISYAHKTAINVTVQNEIVALVMKNVFGYGHKAREKIVPQIVFNFNKNNMEQFVMAYLCGDGYPAKLLSETMLKGLSLNDLNLKVTAATASKVLLTHLSYLMSALGISCSLQSVKAKSRGINGVEANSGESYRLEFWTKQKISPFNFYPIKEGGIYEIKEPKIKWALSNCGQKTILIEKIKSIDNQISMMEDARLFLNGDIGVVRIIEKSAREPREGEYVYDYSVENDENFVGGIGPICLHNSLDACEEAGILPEIDVRVKELSENKYSVYVRDNGPGIPSKHVGKALASVLTGTKFHRYMQQRGQQGIGAGGCTIFALITTGKGIHVKSSTGKEAYECDLSIDIKGNRPLVNNLVQINPDFHGLAVEGEFGEVKYERSEHGVYEYARRTALSNPHAAIRLVEPDGSESVFPRSVSTMPRRPRQILPHPLGISASDLLDFAHASESRKITSFLVDSFSRVTHEKVRELEAIARDVDFGKPPKQLSWEDATKIVNAFKQVKWIGPELDAMSTIGEKQIEVAMRNILDPKFISVVERKPQVFKGGVPFVVEVGIAYGGKAGRTNGETVSGNILRFANKVPLLFDTGSCAITEAVNGIDWKRYSIANFDEEPVSVLVNVSSVYIPYSGVGKQAIAQEDEIVEEIKLAVQDAGRKLQRFLSGERHRSIQESGYKTIMRYVSQLASDLEEITGRKREETEKELRSLIDRKYKNLFGEKGEEIEAAGQRQD